MLDLNRFSISQKIALENRFKNDKGNDCLLSVDGTDFQRLVFVQVQEVCWICGPWKPGKYNDLDIFREALATSLEPNERVKADDCYPVEAPSRVKCPASIDESVERAAMTQ